jgi:hypothetical protein
MKQILRSVFFAFLFATGFVAQAQIDTTCTQVSFSLTGGTFAGEVSFNIVNSAGATVATGTPATTPSGVW